jgi:hypothetical protein
MRFFCPRCWSDFPNDVTSCPDCGLDIPAYWRGKDYVGKLTAALKHPETETVIRAATILGDLHEKAAVKDLIEILAATSNVYVACAAVIALGRIGTPRARKFLAGVSRDHPANMVRDAARAWSEIQTDNTSSREKNPPAKDSLGRRARRP